MWRGALSDLPFGLPVLRDEETPVTERTIVPFTTPLRFDLQSECYRRYPIFGSATKVHTSLTLNISLAVTVTTAASAEAANGIYFGNDRCGFALLHRRRHWHVFRYLGGDIVFSRQFWKTSRRRSAFSIRLTDAGRGLRIHEPGARTVSYGLGDAIFESADTAYLSAQVAPGCVVQILGASIRDTPDGHFERALAWTPPLHRLAHAHGLTFGTLPDGGWYGSVLDHALLTTHANLMVWHLDWDEFANLATATRLAFARAHDMRVRAHPLVWHEHLPAWLRQGSFTPTELTRIMHERITSLMTNYAVDEWVVVNEAISGVQAHDYFVDNVFYRAFGPEYVDLAFHLAHEADPKAVLLYNDCDIETLGPKTERVYELLRGMLRRGVPVHGLGMQFHLLTWTNDVPTRDELMANLARLADLGLDVYVTELDVNLVHLTGSEQEKSSVQAQLYRDVVESCLAAGICKSVTTWGFNDRASWLYDLPCGGENPLLFDRDDRVKPAFTAIQEALARR